MKICILYLSRSEDKHWNVWDKQLPRLSVAHFLYEILTLIDEKNKALQNSLALEKSWPTKICWICIITTLLGMAFVSQRWDCNMRFGHISGKTYMFFDIFDDADDPVDDFDIPIMTSIIGKLSTNGTF